MSCVLWFSDMQFLKLKQCCHVYFRQRRSSPVNASEKTTHFQAFNWTIMTIPTDTCRVQDASPLPPLISPLNNPSHFWMTDTILFTSAFTSLPRMTKSNNNFSKTLVDVFPPWHCVSTHLNALDQHAAKMSGLIVVGSPADNTLIKCIWLAAPSCYWAS